MSEILSDLVNDLGFYKMYNIISQKIFTPDVAPLVTLLSPVNYPLLRLTWHSLKSMLSTVLGFPEGISHRFIPATEATGFSHCFESNEINPFQDGGRYH